MAPYNENRYRGCWTICLIPVNHLSEVMVLEEVV